MPVEEHRPGKWRVRIRWRGLSLSVACETKAAAEELDAALVALGKADRADILAHLEQHPDRLSRAVEQLRRIQPRALTLDDLAPPELTAETLTVRAAYDLWAAHHAQAGSASKRGEPYRPRVWAGYAAHWAKFVAWLAATGRRDLPVAKLTPGVLGEFRRWLLSRPRDESPAVTNKRKIPLTPEQEAARQRKPVTQATANRYLISIRAWYSWLRDHEDGLGLTLPDLVLKQRGEGKRVPRSLTIEEIRALRAAMSPPEWWLLFAVLHETGMRLTECLGLRVREVDLAASLLRIGYVELASDEGRDLKSDHAVRYVGLTTTARAVLEPLVEWARAPDAYVWPEALRSPDGLRSAWRRARQKSGVRARIHDLRHSFGMALADANQSAQAIRDALGHASISTSDRYLRERANRERARQQAQALDARKGQPGESVPELPPTSPRRRPKTAKP